MIPHPYHITRVQVYKLVRAFKFHWETSIQTCESFLQTIPLYGNSHIPYQEYKETHLWELLKSYWVTSIHTCEDFSDNSTVWHLTYSIPRVTSISNLWDNFTIWYITHTIHYESGSSIKNCVQRDWELATEMIPSWIQNNAFPIESNSSCGSQENSFNNYPNIDC